jgi:hypothetical protein
MVRCSAYTSHEEAARAVQELVAAGADVRVLMGQPEHDARAEEMGAFAGAVSSPPGGFAGMREGAGAFAGDGDQQRGGSFADVDRDVVTTYPDGVPQMRVAGHRRIKRYLMDAGLDEATAEKDVRALHMGRILVLSST